MNILITGFEPFAGRTVNLSWKVASRIAALPEFADVVKAVRLPVSFGKTPAAIREAMTQFNPDVVLMLGFSSLRTCINVERVAINVKDARIPDNDGNRPVDEPIVVNGLNAIFSTLPIKSVLAAIESAGVDAKISNSAGTYVCNTSFYTALYYAQQRHCKVGFVHLPDMDVEVAVNGITAAIKNILVNE